MDLVVTLASPLVNPREIFLTFFYFLQYDRLLVPLFTSHYGLLKGHRCLALIMDELMVTFYESMKEAWDSRREALRHVVVVSYSGGSKDFQVPDRLAALPENSKKVFKLEFPSHYVAYLVQLFSDCDASMRFVYSNFYIRSALVDEQTKVRAMIVDLPYGLKPKYVCGEFHSIIRFIQFSLHMRRMDDDSDLVDNLYDDHKRDHSALEQTRKDNIEGMYTSLKDMVPDIQNKRASRAVILRSAIELIEAKQRERAHLQAECDRMREKTYPVFIF
uniref:BHLH domain-containing protein n=1 Tax=Angiostrongylus cantonensis TaxID=6313 RepID=A0A0K0D9A2_ANGCA